MSRSPTLLDRRANGRVERRAGRPVGQQRQAVQSWINGYGQFTMRAMACTLGLSLPHANNTLARLRDAGLVQVAGATRTPECKRPVTLYEAVRAEPLGGRSSSFDLSRVWA